MRLKTIALDIKTSISIKSEILNDHILIQKISDLADKCRDAINNGGKVIFCGNGGSFADAQHLSAEFTSRFLFDRPGMASLVLGANSSAISAIGNDYGYENVFAREIQAIATSNDVLIGITTSGKSVNILRGISEAKKQGIYTVVLTGSSRGELPEDVYTIGVPSTDSARIQESHIMIGHIICRLVEADIFG